MKNSSTISSRIPFLPLAIESAVRAAQPLAENLANAAPELARFSRDEVSSQYYNAEQCAENAKSERDLAELKIEIHLQTMGELFLALNTYLQRNGTYVEALATVRLNRADENRLAQALICQVQSEEAKEHVLAVVHVLSFDAKQLPPSDMLEPGALFMACKMQLEVLQKSWKNIYARYMSKALELQNRSLYAVAANCLVNLAETALDDVLCFEEVPTSLEDILIALECATTHPYSGAWPQSIAISINQTAVPSVVQGEQA